MKRRAWEAQAENWIAWTREVADDAYRDHAPGFYDAFLPVGARNALDLGCGEGRSARDLAARSERTTGVDGSFTLVRAARDEGGRGAYVQATRRGCRSATGPSTSSSPTTS